MSSKKRGSIDSRDKIRSGSRSALPSSGKLRMDSRPQQPRITGQLLILDILFNLITQIVILVHRS